MISQELINHIVNVIKFHCKEQGMSINRLLLQAKSTKHLIDDWMHGRSEPSLPALIRLCEILNIQIDELFKNQDTSMTESQDRLLREWHCLSPIERKSVSSYIEAMKEYHIADK